MSLSKPDAGKCMSRLITQNRSPLINTPHPHTQNQRDRGEQTLGQRRKLNVLEKKLGDFLFCFSAESFWFPDAHRITHGQLCHLRVLSTQIGYIIAERCLHNANFRTHALAVCYITTATNAKNF